MNLECVRFCSENHYIRQREIQGPSGLSNTSEACYMNSMIHAVAASDIFIRQLENISQSRNIPSLEIFLRLLRGLNTPTICETEANEAVINNSKLLEEFIESIGWNKPSQQDAFDLLSAVIKGIHHGLKQIGDSDFTMPMKIRIVHRLNDGAESDKVQYHLGLSLGLCGNYKEKPGESLEYLISQHFVPTLIDDDPSKTAELCFFEKAPKILLLHIQANKWDNERGEMVKPEYYIQYKEKITLELKIIEKLGEKPNTKRVKYKLKSFVSHMGNISGGHYVTYRMYRNNWFLVNDTEVEEINFQCTEVPYVMIYEKKLSKSEKILSFFKRLIDRNSRNAASKE